MNLVCSSATRKQITVLGINSRFGQAVSFLLKQSPIANRLVLFDESDTDVAHDLSAINTTCKLVVYNGEEQLRCAVKNADLILISDKDDPGPNVDETISKAAPDVIKYAEAISSSAPNAIVLVAASPVNTMMSLFSEVQMRHGTFDCDRVMGVTSVDTMRASTVLARHMNLNPEKVHLPVIGGSSPDTRIPLFSQSRPAITACKADLRKMTRMVKMSECELFKLLNRGDAMNKAYATVRLIDSVMLALRGQRNISEIVLSKTCQVNDVDYFSLPVILGPRGIAHRFPIPCLTERENILLEHAIKFIQVDIQKAVDIVCKNAKSHHCQPPEKTKAYSDLFECDKKGIFVGALLDRLRIRKEACKPKLEYLLMSKNNDLVYPPECVPCLTPKLIKFVEPDPIPNDGCCPVQLPCPPSPPKRGLTVIPPKRAKCKIDSSPCPYPPVVKLPKTCNLCDRGTPCEHYANCKNLYGGTKCCGNVLLSLETKPLLNSKSEQPAVTHPAPPLNQATFVSQEGDATVAGTGGQQVAHQQFNNCMRSADKLYSTVLQSSSDVPQSTTSVHSVPLSNLDNIKANSVEHLQNVAVNSPSVAVDPHSDTVNPPNAAVDPPRAVSETHCPYGMSGIYAPESGYNISSSASQQMSEETNFPNNQTHSNMFPSQSSEIHHSERAEQSRVNLEVPAALHSYSVPSPSVENPNLNSVPNREKSYQRGQTSSPHPPICSSCANLMCPNPFPLRRNIDEAVDQCLSRICLAEISSGKESAPPSNTHYNNKHNVAANPSNVGASAGEFPELKPTELPGVHASVSDRAHESNSHVHSCSCNVTHFQFSAKSNSTAPSLPTKSKAISEEETLPVQSLQSAHTRQCAFVEEAEQAQNNLGNFNYSGGLGMQSTRLETDSSNPHFSFNPWSPPSHTGERHYNDHSANNEKKSSKEEQVASVTELTLNSNRKPSSEIQKPAGAEITELVKENIGCTDWNTAISRTSNDITDLHKSHFPLLNIVNQRESKEKCRKCTETAQTSPSKHAKMQTSSEQCINELDTDIRMRENIRANIQNVRLKNSNKNNAENTKILGFGQIINALIPSTKFSKRTDRKSDKRDKRSRSVPRKLYVETHSNIQTTDTKEKRHEKKRSAVMLPVAISSSVKDCTQNNTKNNCIGSKTYDVHAEAELSKLALIRCKVQEALKNIIYPPPYKQKSGDREAKQEKQVERLLQENLKRASSVIKDNVREVRKVESAFEPEGQKLYAPKCPSRLIFGNRPDSRVITFNNVREFEGPKVKTERVTNAGEMNPGYNAAGQTTTFVSANGKETSEKSVTVGEKQTSDSHLSGAHHYEKIDTANRDKINTTVQYFDLHNSDYWTPESQAYVYRAPPPVSEQRYVQNQPLPIQLPSSRSQPTFNKEYMKNILGQRTLREKRTEARHELLESIIKERSKKVVTPGSVRLARKDDPKYGLTSPNRIRANR